MNKEMWKDIRDYEGLYQVSNFGRIKSLARKRKIGFGRLQPMPEKILKPNNAKYRAVQLSREGVTKTKAVHRMVLTAFVGNPPDKYEANHIDGNKYNNYLSNLEWVSSSENTLHSYRLGLQEKRQPQKKAIE